MSITTRKRRLPRLSVVGLGLAAAAAAASLPAASAATATQVVTGAIGSSVTISTSPTATADFGTFSAAGLNSVSGGQIGVTANAPYTVSVVGLKDKLTKYASGAYDDSVKLTNNLLLLTTLSSGAGVPVASVAVTNVSLPIAAGVGLGTDVYSLTFNVTTLITDAPATYRNDLTYTAAATV